MYFDYTFDGVRKELVNNATGIRDEEYIAMLSHYTSDLLELLEQLKAGSDLTESFDRLSKIDLHTFNDELVSQIVKAEKQSAHIENHGKELCALYPLFLDMMDGFYFIMNDQLVIQQISDTVFPQLGYHQNDLTGRDFTGLLPADDKDKVKKAIISISGNERKFNSKIRIEIELADHKNKHHPYQLILCRNTGKAGWLGLCIDIRDLRRREEQLINEKNNAELNDKMKSNYLANMSHEIRTPLNGIVGFASMLNREDITAEKREKYVRIIRSGSMQLLSLINDIIDLSKIEAGQVKILDQKVDVHQLFEELLVTFISEAKRLEKKDIRILKQVTRSRSGLTIRGDGVRIKQVLNNFLGNALKFTQKGEILFGYSLETHGSIMFFVRDSGLGIPLSDQQSVFDRFKQTREGSKEKYEGTGLGLAISKGIVELMGGSIGVRSEPGKGSEFFFTLPLEECE